MDFTSEYFEQIIAAMPGNVYWKDQSGKYLGCNDGFAKILKLHSRRDIIGKTDFDFLDDDKAKIINDNDLGVIANNTEMLIEEEGLDVDKNPAFYITRKVPLRNAQGKAIGVLGISLDITERKKAEQTMVIAKEKAEEAVRVKLDFIRNMEHDIRTPFCGVYGMAKLMLDNETDSQKKEMLTDISVCAKELLDYCNTILDFSKLETHNIPVMQKKFSLRELIEKIRIMETPIAKMNKLDFSCEISDDIPEVLIGDSFRISRILINFCSNSMKFTHAGYVKLRAKLLSRNESRVVIRLEVEDSGIGIPEDKRDFIYEKFTKIIPSNKGTYKGLGIGLNVVKQFTAELDGELDLLSEPNKGSTFICTFSFKLPLVQEIINHE